MGDAETAGAKPKRQAAMASGGVTPARIRRDGLALLCAGVLSHRAEWLREARDRDELTEDRA